MNDPDEEHEPEDVGPKVAAGLAVAGAGVLLGPAGAFILGAASPLFESLAERAWEELRPDARRRTAEMLNAAAEAAECDAEQLGELIGASDRTRLQAGLAMSAAERTAWPPKVRALGKVLAAGLIADDDAIDLPMFALNAMIELDRLHVSLLDLLVRYDPHRISGFQGVNPPRPLTWTAGVYNEVRHVIPLFEGGPPDPSDIEYYFEQRFWSAENILRIRPELGPVLPSVVGTLIRHGLAEQTDRPRKTQNTQKRSGKYAALSSVEQIWSPTELGQQVLGFYVEAAAEAD